LSGGRAPAVFPFFFPPFVMGRAMKHVVDPPFSLPAVSLPREFRPPSERHGSPTFFFSSAIFFLDVLSPLLRSFYFSRSSRPTIALSQVFPWFYGPLFRGGSTLFLCLPGFFSVNLFPFLRILFFLTPHSFFLCDLFSLPPLFPFSVCLLFAVLPSFFPALFPQNTGPGGAPCKRAVGY